MIRQIYIINILPFFLLFFSYTHLWGQASDLGLPPIHNFPKSAYQAGTQNWDILQDPRGVIYVANNEGLLTFDGQYWDLYPLPNRTILRSIALDTLTGRIYAGGQGELGYFFPDARGQLTYISLVELMPREARQFEDVWDIACMDNSVFFRTQGQVFRLESNQIEVFTPGGTLTFMGLWKDQLWLQRHQELLTFQSGQFISAVPSLPFPSEITSLLPFRGDTLLITTLKNGIYFLKDQTLQPWTTRMDERLRDHRIYCATLLSGDRIALGTASKGLLILQPDRTMQRMLSRRSKLQNNNILHLFVDRDQNLWLGLDNGIDLVEITSPISMIYPDGNQDATGYAVSIFEDRIYFATSNGLYTAPWQISFDLWTNDLFEKVKGTVGQVWSLNQIDDQLFMGHHDGPFLIKANQAIPIASLTGAWLFVPLQENLVLGGTYNGLVLYEREEGQWRLSSKLNGMEESCRIIALDNEGAIWVSHPYRGVFRITLNPDQLSVNVASYGAEQGLPSNLFNYVYSINGKALVAAEKGIFHYNPGTNSFEPDTAFHKFFDPRVRVKYLREDQEGNIWFAAGHEIGVLRVEDKGIQKKIRKQVFPALQNQLVGGFEHIYPYDSLHVFMGSERGFLLLNPALASRQDSLSPQPNIREVRLINLADSLIFGGIFSDGDQIFSEQHPDHIPELPRQWNNLRFSCSAPDFITDHPEFRFFLKGFDKDWSDWHPKTEREYTNLPPGSYTFQVQYRKPGGQNSPSASYSFVIAKPWYATHMALLFYTLAGAGAILGLTRYQQYRLHTAREELTSVHRKKEAFHKDMVQRTQKEVSRLQNEKLETEIQFKNKELASATMHLVQKGEMLLKIQEELKKLLKKHQASTQLRREINRIIAMVASDKQLDNDWKQFANHFDQVYIDFQQRLRERYPQLSPNDYKLCSYLRMNLSSKEIASLMNISIRGVEASRYRLRKKLDLPTEVNLTEFIMAL